MHQLILKAMSNLGYNNGWVLTGDTYEGIDWIIEPIKKPTKKEILDAIANLPTPEKEQIEREAKLASAINKLESLGLTESEAKIIIGIE